jgi:hypothetical protein
VLTSLVSSAALGVSYVLDRVKLAPESIVSGLTTVLQQQMNPEICKLEFKTGFFFPQEPRNMACYTFNGISESQKQTYRYLYELIDVLVTKSGTSVQSITNVFETMNRKNLYFYLMCALLPSVAVALGFLTYSNLKGCFKDRASVSSMTVPAKLSDEEKNAIIRANAISSIKPYISGPLPYKVPEPSLSKSRPQLFSNGGTTTGDSIAIDIPEDTPAEAASRLLELRRGRVLTDVPKPDPNTRPSKRQRGDLGGRTRKRKSVSRKKIRPKSKSKKKDKKQTKKKIDHEKCKKVHQRKTSKKRKCSPRRRTINKKVYIY